MKKIKSYLEKWINFQVHDTNEEGIYQIYAGVSKEGIMVDISSHGFNLYFGNNKTLTEDIHEYGFSSTNSFKKAVIITLYYISRMSAQEIIGEHIVAAIRKGKQVDHTDTSKYIWEGNAQDCPGKWSIYIDLRKLE